MSQAKVWYARDCVEGTYRLVELPSVQQYVTLGHLHTHTNTHRGTSPQICMQIYMYGDPNALSVCVSGANALMCSSVATPLCFMGLH
jgi:DNA repair exonuclease SbcCD nuclease subunit